ncbi:MAG TPA: hypothetical protein VEI97_00025, partial [bacterium]|nr:hypothetical protein [bacterium]
MTGRFLLALWLLVVLALPVRGQDNLVRLQPLPANPPSPTDTPVQAYARGNQAGGILGNTALVFLPITPGYVTLLAEAKTTPPDELPSLGPWTDAFLIQFNAYSYEGGAAEDVTGRYGTAVFTLRWGAPTKGDSSLVPEPAQSLELEQVGQTSGLWLVAAFPSTEEAQEFELAQLRQLRMDHQGDTLVIELGLWDKLKLLSDPKPPAPPATHGVEPIE